jgi:hypothetical protein
LATILDAWIGAFFIHGKRLRQAFEQFAKLTRRSIEEAERILSDLPPTRRKALLEARAKQRTDRDSMDKARSEIERVFFEILQACPETAGVFELNGSIPAEGWGKQNMEIDFLSISLKIEIRE